MDDKHIGELWEWVSEISPNDGTVHNWEVRDLIRKLVEERARRYSTGLDWAGDWPTQIPSVLRDFGIDPETWEHQRGSMNVNSSRDS